MDDLTGNEYFDRVPVSIAVGTRRINRTQTDGRQENKERENFRFGKLPGRSL